MGETMGVLLKKEELGAADQLFKKVIMSRNARNLIQYEKIVEGRMRKLSEAVKKHYIEGVKMNMDEVNKAAKSAAEASYRLAMNNFIVMRAMMHSLNEIIIVAKRIYNKTKNKEVEKVMNRLKDDWKILQNKLYPIQTQLYNLEKKANAQAAFGLVKKEAVFAKSSIINYLQMRYSSTHIINYVRDIQRFREEALKDFKKLENKALAKKDFDTFISHGNRVGKEAKRCAELSYKLLTVDNRIVNIILDKVTKGMNLDKELAERHEIPRVMELADENTKKQILAFFQSTFRAEWKAIQQEAAMPLAA